MIEKNNGKLEVAEGNTSQLSNLSMESYLRNVAEVVESFGLKAFFYIKDIDGKMKYLPEEPYSFTIDDILAEHTSRLVEPSVITNSQTPHVETPESTLAWLHCYDPYEKCDFSISRLVIESLVHPELRAEIIVQFSLTPSFKKLPVKYAS